MPTRPSAGHAASKAAAGANQDSSDDDQPRGWLAEIKLWVAEAGGAYLASMLFHAAVLLVLFLVLGARYIQQKLAAGTKFEAVELAQVDDNPPQIEKLDVVLDDLDDRHLPLNIPDPGDGNLEDVPGTPTSDTFARIDENPIPIAPSGTGFAGEPTGPVQLGGVFDAFSLKTGPAINGTSGTNPNGGDGNTPGKHGDGDGNGFDHRRPQGGPAGKPRGPGDKNVALALNWLASHQNKDGSWSLSNFSNNCRYGKCTGHGTTESDAAATALALLPFLAAGHTHFKTEGWPDTYVQTVYRGLNWLMTHQNKTDGDLSAGSGQMMYTHGLATIALCEAHGMTDGKDKYLGKAAQAAIEFIQSAQDKQGGGWRYRPGEAGDTSVVGWQVMALKSGQMANLQVSQQAFERAKKFLAAASGSEYGAKFGYTPGAGGTPTMSGVGLLCRQYLGAAKDDPGLVEGSKYLMVNLPDANANRNVYYWYYATQVMHNMQGDDWDTWEMKVRRILKKTQERQGCPAGSWDPDKPTADAWGQHGGRVMMTSLSCLTLEVYYRNLPLYDLGKKGAVKGDVDAK